MITIDKKKIEQTELALRITGINIDYATVEFFLQVSAKIDSTGGTTTIEDLSELQHKVEEKYKKQAEEV
jgi:hypothetical protein